MNECARQQHHQEHLLKTLGELFEQCCLHCRGVALPSRGVALPNCEVCTEAEEASSFSKPALHHQCDTSRIFRCKDCEAPPCTNAMCAIGKVVETLLADLLKRAVSAGADAKHRIGINRKEPDAYQCDQCYLHIAEIAKFQ